MTHMQLIHEMLDEDQYKLINRCCACGKTGTLELNHDPKRQYHTYGYMPEIPFVTLFPLCGECHDHTERAETYYSLISFPASSDEYELRAIYIEQQIIFAFQRDFIHRCIKRNIKI